MSSLGLLAAPERIKRLILTSTNQRVGLGQKAAIFVSLWITKKLTGLILGVYIIPKKRLIRDGVPRMEKRLDNPSGGERVAVFVACPETGCKLPAEVSDISEMPSTHGVVEMARVQCPDGHHFLLPYRQVSGTETGPSQQEIDERFAEIVGNIGDTDPDAR